MILQIKGTTSIKLSKMDAMMQTTKSKKQNKTKQKQLIRKKNKLNRIVPFINTVKLSQCIKY